MADGVPIIAVRNRNRDPAQTGPAGPVIQAVQRLQQGAFAELTVTDERPVVRVVRNLLPMISRVAVGPKGHLSIASKSSTNRERHS